mgnify:CR=1
MQNTGEKLFRSAVRTSGQSVKNWMAEDEIGEQSYYYWLRSIGSEMW